MKHRLHHESGEQVEERLHNDDGIPFQAPRGGTSLNGDFFLLQLVSFTVDV